MQQKRIYLILLVFTLICITSTRQTCQAEDEPLPENALESTGDVPLLLPPLKEESDQRLSSAASVYVKRFKLKGNTVYSDDELAFIVSPYEERKISSEELHDVKNKISLFYYTNGYVNSGAVIPDQKITDGYITIKIIEGTLPKISVTGNTHLKSKYISRRLEIATGDGKAPLNINTLQDRLKIIKQNPRVENINANLSPGLKLGEAELEVTIKEARPYFLTVEVNNSNSPSVGAYRADIQFEHINVSGWGDSFRLKYGITEGLDTYSSKYEIPFTRWGTTFSLEADRAKSVVVAQPFDDKDIKGDTTTMGFGFKHPFYKTVSSELLMGLKFEHRKSNTYMMGMNMSFTSGVDNGESKVSVVRFSQEWIQRSLEQVVAARSTFSFGLDVLDATKADAPLNAEDTAAMPNGTFAAWLGQFQWIRRIAETQLIARLDLRLSDSPLLSIEKFAIGGRATVRGYRENLMTPDNGLIASLEWRVPVAQWNIPALTKNQKQGMVYLAPFFDYGLGGNTKSPDPAPRSISSLGLGLRWSISEKIYSEIYWGYALRDIDRSTEYDLQDDGLHFMVSTSIFE
ncbi:MAG: ShlB/FhaC/HecB family hemolysin secretion/activation protein [Candidatus Magnetomorum sp.]|nr:ShlB/FhaC/HecB family hemolysin secretion/activation protein [Candidatus Magnetomorum sp.]